MYAEFATRINGIPCVASVHYYEGTHYPINSASLLPNEAPEIISVQLWDRKGYRARWLDKYLTQEVHDRLLSEAMEHNHENAD